MGHLTMMVLRNDQLHLLLKNPKKLAELIEHHASGGRETRDLNSIKFFQPRHSDDQTLYVLMGNDVYEMDPCSAETEDLIKNHPDFFDEMLKYIEEQTEELKKKRLEYRK